MKTAAVRGRTRARAVAVRVRALLGIFPASTLRSVAQRQTAISRRGFVKESLSLAVRNNGALYVDVYRGTYLLDSNLPLTSKDKFRIGLACPALARPKRNFWFDVNRRLNQRDVSPCSSVMRGIRLSRWFAVTEDRIRFISCNTEEMS